MVTRGFTAIICAALAAAALAGAPPAASATPAATPPAAVHVLASQRLSWSWVDGSTATKRTFTQAEYTGREGEIGFYLYAAPEYPQRKVRLEWRYKGKWVVIDSNVTDSTPGEGRALLLIDPICKSGNWCRGTFKLRLHVLKSKGRKAAYKKIKVVFTPNPAITPTPTPTPSAPAPVTSTPTTDCSIYPPDSMEYILCMHDPTKT